MTVTPHDAAVLFSEIRKLSPAAGDLVIIRHHPDVSQHDSDCLIEALKVLTDAFPRCFVATMPDHVRIEHLTEPELRRLGLRRIEGAT